MKKFFLKFLLLLILISSAAYSAKVEVFVEEINDLNFDKKIAQGITVVNYYSDFCDPCMAMAPELEKVAKKFKNCIRFYKINVETSNEHKEEMLPLVEFYRNGQTSGYFRGGKNASEIENEIRLKLLSNDELNQCLKSKN